MKFIIILFLGCVPILGKTFSLMHPAYNKSEDGEGIMLNGIVFVSEKEWVIWINHQRITPTKTPDWLKIIKVTETTVECEYLSNKLWYQVILEPYDTFIPTKKEVNSGEASDNP